MTCDTCGGSLEEGYGNWGKRLCFCDANKKRVEPNDDIKLRLDRIEQYLKNILIYLGLDK